ncbi:MAG: SPFH domain-containing protein [Acidimicrobiales bacterium]
MPLLAMVVLIIFGLSAVGGLGGFVAGWKDVPVDKVALHYSGGPIEGERFEKIVQPGTNTRFYGFLDRLYMLPATQRNYIMSKDPKQSNGGRAEYVGAPSSDKVMTEWESATYFKLNTEPGVLRSFFEQICLRYTCTDLVPGGGWDHMLADTFRQQIVAAIQAEARRHTSEDIYANAETLLSMQAAIGSTLKQRVNAVLGGEYFCGPTYDPDSPVCPEFSFVIKELALPDNVREQYNANRASALAVEKARSDAQSQAVLRGAPELTPGQLDYIRAQAELECARRPGCVLVVTNGAASVEVNASPSRP